MFQTKVVGHMVPAQELFFPANQTAYEIVWKNMAQPDTPQITTQYSACTLHVN
jgi:hypothetical protein